MGITTTTTLSFLSCRQAGSASQAFLAHNFVLAEVQIVVRMASSFLAKVYQAKLLLTKPVSITAALHSLRAQSLEFHCRWSFGARKLFKVPSSLVPTYPTGINNSRGLTGTGCCKNSWDYSATGADWKSCTIGCLTPGNLNVISADQRQFLNGNCVVYALINSLGVIFHSMPFLE